MRRKMTSGDGVRLGMDECRMWLGVGSLLNRPSRRVLNDSFLVDLRVKGK